MKAIILIFLLIGLTVSCVNKSNEKKPPGLEDLKTESNKLEVNFKKVNNTGITEESKENIVSASNKSALNLYSYLNSENPDKNIFFSSYSIFTAMAMSYEGASGQTASQMQSVFYFPENSIDRRSEILNINNRLNKPKKEYQLLTANALWIQGDLQSKLFAEIRKYYGGEVFIKAPAIKVNKWIEDKTMNRFKNVVKDCKSLCGLSLINTIYFKGDWEKKFEKANTEKNSFTINEEEKTKVPMMNMTETFNYMGTETMQILEIPYKGEELSMLILLPRDFPKKSKKDKDKDNKSKSVTIQKKPERADLTSLEKALTTENIKKWRKALQPQEVRVYVPKFTFKKHYELSETLKQYMPLVFNKKKADFLKFAENIKKGENNLYIKEIIHKSFIDVNEEGTEATAVTVIGMSQVSSVPPPPPIFRADHPFVFLIQERKTGYILFMGKVVNPKNNR